MNDDHRDLSRLLQSWQPHPPEAAPEFSHAVWARIERAAAPSQRAGLFGLPATVRAAACWAVALSAFGGSAAAYAYDSLTRDERMAAAHARAIDPLQITAAPRTVHRH